MRTKTIEVHDLDTGEVYERPLTNRDLLEMRPITPLARTKPTRETPPQVEDKQGWVSVAKAAQVLGEPSPEALRKRLDRNATKTPEGLVEAQFDGIKARKFGRNWRLQLGSWRGQ